MTEQELDQRREDLCQMNMEQLRCGVMLQLHMIESLTDERNEWQARCEFSFTQRDKLTAERDALKAENDKLSDLWSQMKLERDALMAAARLALDALKAAQWKNWRTDKAIDALKAVL